MNNTIALNKKEFTTGSILFDLAAVTFVYFTPAISHMINIPLYLADPMRIIILLSLIYTSRKNAYLIALTLPLFSFIISSHPLAIKSLLITSELILNIFLFYRLSKYISNYFLLMFTSILISKIFYYTVKYVLINTTLLPGELISTPILLQLGVMLIISGYFYIVNLNTSKN